PDGRQISVPSNNYIMDVEGNPVLNQSLVDPANTVTIQAAASDLPATYPDALDWDVDPPIVAPFQPGGSPTGFRELVTVESGGLAQYIDHLDIHFLGNQSDQAGYDSETDHPTPEQEGVRLYSFINAFDDGALALGFEGDTAPPVLDTTNTSTPSISSLVDNTVFVPPPPAPPAPIDRYDDGYVRINIDEAVLQYGTQSNLWFSYTPSPADVNASGIITDHAGNMARPLSQAGTIERQPPVFVGALAIAGNTRVYLRFNEFVLANIGGTRYALDDAAITPEILEEIFQIVDQAGNPTGVDVTGIQLLQRSSINADAASDMFLELSGPITQEGAVRWRIEAGPGPAVIEDPFTSPISSAESNRITDVALNVVQPSAAWNDIQREDLYGDEFQGIISANEFDGSGELLERATRLQLTVLDPVNYGLPLQLYVDADVDDRFTSNQFGPEFWLPQESTLIAQPDTSIIEALPANLDARVYLPVEQTGGVAEFVIPEDDPAISGGLSVELVPSIAGVPAARLTEASDPRSFEPFSFTVQPLVVQRGGVTILNNVIWPQRGDVTLLTYELQRAGVVTVQVFTLDGQLVSVLQRGRQAAGRQMVSWDGMNSSGQMVASGLYFIRVVGPDIDQIRKVIVAKE
ncbi:MAG: FlgD immunoglobulin-like domain containing protein, partial [Spirochaetota bacterium]